MSSFSSTDSSEEHQEKQCKYRKQKFNNKWLDDDNFSGWLEAVANDVFKCKCAACDKVLNCGMCSDGASVMIGQHNSFASRLIGDIPNAIVVKCICHSAAIIASKAC
ncbi:uncharacterized protein LOC129249997 [Anastrepha obliqua]|uniref:uncharacterized protein LOC129249994 n=1 Tax=Anastrepha obliqua TaxID=95512 RepID=UPI0024097CA9|nr:uncharacterized protein LOC129249994 [Anastrepha obliqua]XP_054745621.1 uncharacterized protein LOC129249997 [Anastrepha obliqua]